MVSDTNHRETIKRLSAGLLCSLLAGAAWAEVPVHEATVLAEFDAPDARQGVAVDAGSFYAVNSTSITRHDKQTGEVLASYDGSEALLHLDSGMVRDGLLYTAHSNYPEYPMTSSVEIFDADTLEPVASHDFGVLLGSMTWLDRHEGHWWGTFANYDKVQPGMTVPYGTTAATVLVKMDADFTVLQQWLFPPELHARFTPMSNSGGSWGDDGYLYITGHDHPEVYAVEAPEQGATVQWLATIHVPVIEGQGIAWDRTAEGRIMWGIRKRDRKIFQFEVPDLEAE